MCTRVLARRLRVGESASQVPSNLFKIEEDPLRCQPLYVAPQQALEWEKQHREEFLEVAHTLREQLLPHPCAVWLTGNDSSRIARQVSKAATARAELFQFVLYNVPNRDRGGFSGGGARSRNDYLKFVRGIARAIGSARGVVILEPDALAHAASFDKEHREERLSLLRDAADILRTCPHVTVYQDAGHPGYLSPNNAAGLLKLAGVLEVRGFAINVSHHYSTRDCLGYAQLVRKFLGDRARFVIDTSRNGVGFLDDGSQFAKINNQGARVGEPPTAYVGAGTPAMMGLDAILWIKVPGETDEMDRGSRHAGLFCPDAAMRLLGSKDEDDEEEGEDEDVGDDDDCYYDADN